MENQKIKSLKEQALTQLKEQIFVEASLCEELISLSKTANDYESLGIGHIWLAESYLLHNENKIACSRELETARNYLNVKKPSEVLENYYSIEYKLYNALYDTQTAFDYCLKALEIAEQLYENPHRMEGKQSYFVNTVENRVVKYYGNIGINFFNQGIYEKALLYCNKALHILESLDDVNVYAECLLRLNIIISLLRTEHPALVMHHIHLIEKLPIDRAVLKIYIDYAYTNYYLYQKDKTKAEFYIHQLLNDQIELHAGRLTAVDFYIDILQPVIELYMLKPAKLIFNKVEDLVNQDELRPLLNLAKLKISFSNTFGQEENQPLYQEYFDLYLKNEKQINDLKIKGLETRLRLNEMELENTNVKKEIHILEDIANYDELTRIFNRRYLELKYHELIEHKGKLLGLAIIDIDYFKEYNDTYGHPAGDKILKTLAACLQDALSEHMMVCRYGGDEFVVLSWNEQPDVLDTYVQKVTVLIDEKNMVHKASRCANRITVTIGYGIQKVNTKNDISALFKKADKTLYLAKEKGRNQIVKIP